MVLNPENVRIGLAGAGPAAARRLAGLRAGGAEPVLFGDGFAPLPRDESALAGLRILYIAGLEEADYVPLAEMARRLGILVNVEDVPGLCDFHAVAEIRRGDLLMTVSTGGAAPGLAGVIRRALESYFGPEWAGRVAEAASLRRGWREEGVSMAEAAQRLALLARERCWLSCPQAD